MHLLDLFLLCFQLIVYNSGLFASFFPLPSSILQHCCINTNVVWLPSRAAKRTSPVIDEFYSLSCDLVFHMRTWFTGFSHQAKRLDSNTQFRLLLSWKPVFSSCLTSLLLQITNGIKVWKRLLSRIVLWPHLESGSLLNWHTIWPSFSVKYNAKI